MTCNVGTGAVNPQAQLGRFLDAMKGCAMVIGPDFLHRPLTDQEMEVAKEIFGKCGYKDGARFLVKRKEGEDPEKMKLVQQLEEMKKALDAKHPPELLAAMVAEKQSTAALKQVEAVNKRVEALFSAMNTAQIAVTTPGVTPVADAIVLSAGFEDQDAGSVIPEVPQQAIPAGEMIPQNTSPMFPANPGTGVTAGIEAGPDVQYDNELGGAA